MKNFNMKSIMHLNALVVSALLTLGLSSQVHAVQTYTVRDLGTLGGPTSVGNGFASSRAVGSADTSAGSSHPCIFTGYSNQDFGTTVIDDYGTYHTYAGGNFISGFVSIAGNVWDNVNQPNSYHAFFYYGDAAVPGGSPIPATQMYRIGGLAGQSINEKYNASSAATASDGGIVVGYSPTGVNNTSHAFAWGSGQSGSSHQLPTDLGTLSGTGNSRATGISNNRVVGASDTVVNGATVGHAFYIDVAAVFGNLNAAGTMQDLGTLGGKNSEANGIFKNGDSIIVGASQLPSGLLHAFSYTLHTGTRPIGAPPDSMQDIGTLGGDYSKANAVSDGGAVVGTSTTNWGARHAFIYRPNTGMIDLNSLIPSGSGWILVEATAINSNGITGYGINPSGQTRAFLLTAASDCPQYFTWTATAVAVGSDNNTRVLWNNVSGEINLWKVSPSGNVVSDSRYGPFIEGPFQDGSYLRWTARTIATAPDGTMRVLWVRSDGKIAVWSVDSDNHYIQNMEQDYGPIPGWTAKSLTVDSVGYTRVLWCNADGTATFWRLNGQNQFIDQRAYGPYSDGALGWTAKSISAGGAFGAMRILWERADGLINIWSVDGNSVVLSGKVYGPMPGWTPQSIAAGSDNTARLLWVNANGQVALWVLDTQNQLAGQLNYAPLVGWSGAAIAVGPYFDTRLLWDNSDGRAGFWTIGGSVTISPDYGPYP